ncbi:MAG: translation initiation factor IF-3 [Planctomycetes bacterium]|nr:translation initiation factor IF-3 [Planctomycetota bacterium]
MEEWVTEHLRKNEEIRGKTLRVIGAEGEQLGIMLVEQAMMKAKEAQLDLVEVSPKATPPVCKIMDYGKHIYKEHKKLQQARKKSHANEIKEVWLKPRIGKHDLEIKLKHAKEFLDEGHRVQFTMRYKGRELAHMEIGEEVLKDVVKQLEDTCKVERGPFREGRRVGLLVAPKPSAPAKKD